MRRMLLIALLVGLMGSAPALAGDDKATMADPMAAMASCHVCKVFMPHMGEMMPLMKSENVTMSNGMATVTTITDAAKVPAYHGVCEKMHAAGEESMEFTEAQADEKLCPMCRKMWGLMADGAHMSYGTTATGDLMVLTSDDPEMQKRIVAMFKEWEAMMGG